MKTYSIDLRERALGALAQGHSHEDVAQILGVSLSSLRRWRQRLVNGQGLAPTPRRGRSRRVLLEQEETLRAQVRTHGDATLDEHLEMWRKQGHTLSRATLDRAIKRLGFTHKKRA